MKRVRLWLIYSFFMRWFLKIFIGVRFDDARFLLHETQFIIVANHNSHLDTLSLMASVPGSIVDKIKPVAAQDYFGRSGIQERLTNFFVNTLLIARTQDEANPGNNPINTMISSLDSGNSLILFPEGTRGEPEKEEPLRPGIGVILSKRPNIKYVPVFMKGMGKAMPKGDNLIIPTNSTLQFGRPTKVKSTRVNDILEQIETDLKALKNNHYCPQDVL